MKKIVFISAFFLVFDSSFAQDIQFYKGKGVGLAQFTCLTIDKSGNKWIGNSKSGLSKFDNKKFTQYNRKNSKIGALIRAVYADSKDRVWVSYGAPNGIACINGTHITYYSKDKIPDLLDYTNLICEDGFGNIYFSGSGLLKFNGVNWMKVDVPVGFDRLYDINKQGQMLILCDGLKIGKNNKWKNILGVNLRSMSAVRFSNEDDLYVGHSAKDTLRISRYKNGKWTQFNKTDTTFARIEVVDIEIDGKGVVWMATNVGLFYFKDQEFFEVKFEPEEYDNRVYDIALEGEKVWIISRRGFIKIEGIF